MTSIGIKSSFYISSLDPWVQTSTLYKPIESSQILPYDSSLCLSIEAFLHMCGLKFETSQVENCEHMSPSGKLPVLHCGKHLISEANTIVEFVNAKGHRLDEHLSDADRNKLKAYLALVNNVLNPAQKYIAWAHEDTNKQITNKRYGSVYQWPLNFIMCKRKKESMLHHLDAIGWGKDQKSLMKIEEEVVRCCNALTEKLGDQLYFFGDKYTEVNLNNFLICLYLIQTN